MERKLYCYLSLTLIVLLHLCSSVSAQEQKRVIDNGETPVANYHDFPVREKCAPELWSRLNQGKAPGTQPYYKYFKKDNTKYVAVTAKQTALESYYVKADDPAAYILVKGFNPINFQRDGQWIEIDQQLRPVGNGIYEATDQWDPVGIDITAKESYVITPSGKVRFNDWTLYGEDDNGRKLLAKANWTNYTIGADGMRIIDIFPGIDAELEVRRGAVKTSFIVHRLKYTQYRKLYFEDSFKGLSGLSFENGNNDLARSEEVHANTSLKDAAFKISPAFAFPKNNPSSPSQLPYSVSGTKLSIEVPVQYLADNLLSGDVVIDPLVQSINSIDHSLVGSMYNASCGFAGSCNYTIPVTPPANTTITGVFIEIYALATAPCGRENFAYQLSTGTCVSPYPGGIWLVGGGATGPGPIFGFRNRSDLMPCMPAPSCTPASIDFTFRLFRSCFGPTGCDNTCVGLTRPLTVILEGRTIELAAITPSPAEVCFGHDINFATSPAFGVPPYSPVNWSLNVTGTPSIGTGNNLTTGAALAPGNYTIYANTTDACGIPVQASRPFTIKPVNTVLHVDDVNGNDNNCGESWTSPLKTVSWALRLSQLSTNVDSIFVAKGTYYPTGMQNGINRDNAFLLSDDRLKLYGGYPNGGGTRDIANNPTILSGDIGTAGDSLDNSYHVVVIPRNVSTDSIIIDGFTITEGNANGAGSIVYESGVTPRVTGGGIYIRDNGLTVALRNLIIKENTASTAGGGMDILNASPTIDNCVFSNNHSLYVGGALINENDASPTISDCSFVGNTTTVSGGAVFNQNAGSMPSFLRCSFIDNAAGNATIPGWAGAMYNRNGTTTTINYCTFTGNTASSGGGAILSDLGSYTSLSHSAFVNNKAQSGDGLIGSGGALQLNGNSTQGMILVNCVLANNIAAGTADDGGGAIMLYAGSVTLVNTTISGNTTTSTTRPNANAISINGPATATLRNSIIWGAAAQQVHRIGTFNYNYSLVKGTAAPLPNLDLDPLFVDASDPAGGDGIWGTPDDGLQLTPCSPAVNMGSNPFALAVTDLTGNPRIADVTVDMGAYELQTVTPVISFTDVIKTYGDPDTAVPNVTNCSGLPTTFTIADNSIADIVAGNLHIIKAGTTTITAHTINGTPDVTVNLIVNPKPITVSLTAAPIIKVYDGNTNATITAANFQLATGDVVGTDDVAIAVAGNGSYDTKDVGTGKTVTVPLANISLTGTTASNYVISNTTDINAAIGIITPLAITVTADPQTKVYGDADPGLTYTNSPALIAGEAFTGALVRSAGENVGAYPINQGTLALSINYTLTYISNNLTITPKAIAVTADPKIKIYGDTDPPLTYTHTPSLVAGDAFTGTLIRTAGENIGTYPINQGTLALSGNYTITYTGDNLTITPLTISVFAAPKTKVYGDADPALTYTYSPALIAGDAFAGALIRTAGENVGAYPISQGTLTLSNNYTIVYNGSNLIITPRAITITAQPKTKVYGDADPALTYSWSPALVAGDAFTGSLIRTAGENAGTYPINQGTLALSSNYQTTYVSASFVITKAVLTLVADDISICFGDALTSGTVSYTGFKNGDDPSSLGTQPRVSIPAIPSAGNYTLTPSGGASNNYDFNYVDGQLTVRPSPTGTITQVQIGPAVVTTPGVVSGVQLTAPLGIGYTYVWSTGAATPVITVTTSGLFSVEVSNPQGCSRTFTVQVRQQTLIIPNIFSPNGDGINDKWVIQNLENFPGNTMQIYNRYGQAVHKIVNYTPWDGRISGKDMPVGTYYYILDPKNGRKPVTGYIDIIR